MSDYVSKFDLSAVQATDVADYIRLWDILRVCCGAQMSKVYRAQLHSLGNSTYTRRNATMHKHMHSQKKHKRVKRSPSDDCDTTQLDDIERRLMQTNVYQSCAAGTDLLGKVSLQDGYLDGTYCSRAREATTRFHLVFNAKRYKTL